MSNSVDAGDEAHGAPTVLGERAPSRARSRAATSAAAMRKPAPPAMQIAMSSSTPCGATNATQQRENSLRGVEAEHAAERDAVEQQQEQRADARR